MENKLKEQFDLYVKNFDFNEQNIQRKYYHSNRVMSLSQLVAKHSGMDSSNYDIAKVVGLLHDYGRFPQWRDYKTFDDNASVDHAT